jgi:sortase A
MRSLLRVLGATLVAVGVLVVVWVVVVWRWQDPLTAIYTHIEQSRLSSRYTKQAATFRAMAPKLKPKVFDRAATAKDARLYGASLHVGDPIGRLQIGRIGLNMIVVQGTDEETLKKGPGHYLTTGLPGEGQLIYVAGHRTTYLAPFSHIDAIRPGDRMTLTVPYGSFNYQALRHYIVPADDLAVLSTHGREILRLQACYPRFFATHRYILDARLVAFRAPGETRWLPVKKA